MEKFVISKNTNGEFQFDFIDKKGKVVLSSGGYTRKLMCLKGIESVKRNSQDNIKFFRKTSLNNETYFNLKAFNGKIIGVSKMFKDRFSRDKGIESLKKKAPDALIEDRSRQSIKMICVSYDVAV
ncbi:YegP family protein [Flavobacterium sp. JAS]|uniref:YegP family protein n=1 Tax=Flavobacterium sp. JAS TaxID=2897329 RepID=UPI001E58E564|nr:YegP family protein [Flavobacterium sp. JAS]MCD0471839.1 YegP family protein [Flavobacterium sp. JAS]